MKNRFFGILVIIGFLCSLLADPDLPVNARSESKSTLDRPSNQEVIPELIGQIGGVSLSIARQGNYAYLSAGPRLMILDVANPLTPLYLGQSGIMPNIIDGVEVVGNYAFVADGFGGLHIIDITIPSSPSEVGYAGTSSSTQAVFVVGNFAYLADGESGLRIIDITEPSAPMEIGSIDTPGFAKGVFVAGNYAYIADSMGGLRIIDISVPTAPQEIGVFSKDGSVDYSDIVVINNYAYVAGGINEGGIEDGGLVVVDISDPAAPTQVGYTFTRSYCAKVVVEGIYAYITEGIAGLEIIDISDPTAPLQIGVYDSLVSVGDVAVDGNYAYVTEYPSGMHVVEITDPTSPVDAGSYEELGIPYGMTVSGDYAYIAYGSNGLAIVDITNPTVLTKVGAYDTPGFARDVRVRNNYAYVVDEDSGLRIIDISNPASPVETGFYDTPGTARFVDLAGDYAYVADEGSGLRIINIADPSAPVEIGSYDTPGYAWQVDVEGNTAYVVDQNQGLRIIDISNPTAPVEVGFFSKPDETYFIAVEIREKYAYIPVVTAVSHELLIIDVTDPTFPIEIGSFFISAYNLMATGNLLYIPSNFDGLHIFDITDPAEPVEVGSYITPGFPGYVWVAGNNVYIGDEDGGMVILRILMDEVSEIIPITGGILTSSDGHTSLIFSAGAFTDTVQVTYKHLFDEHSGYWADIGETFDVSAVYSDSEEPAALASGQNYTITISYSDSQTSPAFEDSLGLYYLDGVTWVREPTSTLDPVNNVITATPGHLSVWAVLGDTNRVFIPVLGK